MSTDTRTLSDLKQDTEKYASLIASLAGDMSLFAKLGPALLNTKVDVAAKGEWDGA